MAGRPADQEAGLLGVLSVAVRRGTLCKDGEGGQSGPGAEREAEGLWTACVRVFFLFGSLAPSPALVQKSSSEPPCPGETMAVAITHSALLTAMTDDSLLLTGPNCATGTHKGGRLGPASPGEGSQAVGGSRREGPVQAGAASE